MKVNKQKVYIPVNGETEKVACIDHPHGYLEHIEGIVEKEAFVFTTEQLNQLLSEVTRNTSAEMIKDIAIKFALWRDEKIKELDKWILNGEKCSNRFTIEELFEEFLENLKQ